MFGGGKALVRREATLLFSGFNLSDLVVIAFIRKDATQPTEIHYISETEIIISLSLQPE